MCRVLLGEFIGFLGHQIRPRCAGSTQPRRRSFGNTRLQHIPGRVLSTARGCTVKWWSVVTNVFHEHACRYPSAFQIVARGSTMEKHMRFQQRRVGTSLNKVPNSATTFCLSSLCPPRAAPVFVARLPFHWPPSLIEIESSRVC